MGVFKKNQAKIGLNFLENMAQKLYHIGQGLDPVSVEKQMTVQGIAPMVSQALDVVDYHQQVLADPAKLWSETMHGVAKAMGDYSAAADPNNPLQSYAQAAGSSATPWYEYLNPLYYAEQAVSSAEQATTEAATTAISTAVGFGIVGWLAYELWHHKKD
jgi:hypothetical protein